MFSWSWSVRESWIHLFIYPAITTSSHFFYKAFISKSYLKASILLCLHSSDTKQDFRKVLVSWSQVVRILDLSPYVFLNNFVSLNDWSSLFLVSNFCKFFKEEFLFFISNKDLWLTTERIFVFRLLFWVQTPKLLKFVKLRLSLVLIAFKLSISWVLNLYPIFFCTRSTKTRYCNVFLCSQIS